jgi:hypothetical protein
MDSDTPDPRIVRRKRQQKFRKRKESLFGKADELSELCAVDVVMIVRHPQQERFFTFQNIDERFWPPGIAEIVSQLFKNNSSY